MSRHDLERGGRGRKTTGKKRSLLLELALKLPRSFWRLPSEPGRNKKARFTDGTVKIPINTKHEVMLN